MDAAPVLVRYARSGSDEIAWSEVGDGPAVVIAGWWMSHVERDWEYPPFRRFIEQIARHRRVVRLDAPGSGLSRSRRSMPAEPGPHADAIDAVMDAARIDRATVFGGSFGAPVAMTYAARHPDRVARLVLAGSYLDGNAIGAPADRDALVDLVRQGWGVSARVMADILYPDATAEQRAAYTRHQRETATPAAAAAGLAAVYAIGARPAAPLVTAPTLVLHRRGDRAMRLELGRETADAIPGARFEVLSSQAHHPWHGAAAELLQRALQFDGVDGAPPAVMTRDDVDAAGGAASTSPLTEREQEILLLVSRGRTDAQIAADLFLSVHTVHRHVANARAKLGASSRAAAAAWVVRRAP